MDEIFTLKGVWGFNPDYVMGYYLFHLPIEEILFFICIPYSSVFTFHCFSIFGIKNKWFKNESLLTISLVIFLLTFGPVFFTKLYTAFTFISLGLLIFFLKFYLDVKWLGTFYFSYLILLLPFLIVNGILTGTGLNNPVVWYNNNENMGIRFLTIPFEDVFYGMGLILLNVSLFEFFKKQLGILTNNE
jgi:lycopene cyclase domain-containing protein